MGVLTVTGVPFGIVIVPELIEPPEITALVSVVEARVEFMIVEPVLETLFNVEVETLVLLKVEFDKTEFVEVKFVSVELAIFELVEVELISVELVVVPKIRREPINVLPVDVALVITELVRVDVAI